MTDRFSNPVPDGTTATFQTTLGGIQATCQTGATTSGSGACVVNWVSKTPYTANGNPQSTSGNASANAAYCPGALCNGTTNGRSPIMVSAIGEESFVDTLGNGVFDLTFNASGDPTGDTVAFNASDLDNDFPSPLAVPSTLSAAQLAKLAGTAKSWQDTSEPFLNEWELYDAYGTPTFVAGEPYVDFNNNGVRDGPDGLVESALCEGPLCNTTQPSVAIGANNVIIVSGSHANFTPAPGASLTIGGGNTFTFRIADDRNQQMPNGTTVAATISTNAGTAVGPTSYTWPCASAVGGASFSFSMTQAAAPQPGTLIITVTTPGGIVTTGFYNLTD
jgi:hypothetical protein